MQKKANHLVNEQSLYLRQHMYNPVDWYPWSEEAWERARKENKLVIVSIGYSSCHWCHVMEHESFENDLTATLMNEMYVCIKVDREERPDIDQVYMLAVQLMTGRGGWPLNCFTLPDGKPMYGGTYFTNPQWNEILVKLNKFWIENPEKTQQFAGELTESLSQKETAGGPAQPSVNDLREMVSNWSKGFDKAHGGQNKAPKFPMPDNYDFLLQYADAENDAAVMEHVHLTLTKMSLGGIYDQIGGGFTRYSTDGIWKVPHFEKMLYDNAQLTGLYADAYRQSGNELYRETVYHTFEFLEREMRDVNGCYYAALDADSEGVEGKYYVWTGEEFESANWPAGLRRHLPVIRSYFNINANGHWEHGRHIPLRVLSDEQFATANGIDVNELKAVIREARQFLQSVRGQRTRPGLDTKIITSWNALMVSALCKCHQAFGDDRFLDAAEKCIDVLTKEMKDGRLVHITGSTRHSPAFLEDYAFMSGALIELYETTFKEKYLEIADRLIGRVMSDFSDDESGMFWFTSSAEEKLIARKQEVSDNVTPSSNAVTAMSLYRAGLLLGKTEYSERALRMVATVRDTMIQYGPGYSHWGKLALRIAYPSHEAVFTGPDALSHRLETGRKYLPRVLFAGSTEAESNLPLLKDREVENRNLIYICEDKTCQLPVNNPGEALALLQR